MRRLRIMNKRSPNPRRALRLWLKGQKKSQTAFAREVGLAVSTVNDILQGRRNPGLTAAASIERLTGIPAVRFANLPTHKEASV